MSVFFFAAGRPIYSGVLKCIGCNFLKFEYFLTKVSLFKRIRELAIWSLHEFLPEKKQSILSRVAVPALERVCRAGRLRVVVREGSLHPVMMGDASITIDSEEPHPGWYQGSSTQSSPSPAQHIRTSWRVWLELLW